MAGFGNFIARGSLFVPSEGSRLHSPREKNAPSKQWRPVAHHATEVAGMRNKLSQITAQVGRMRQPPMSSSGMHPFKIYQFPSGFRRYHNADDWRRFKVRAGDRIRIGGGTGAAATVETVPGTDSVTSQDSAPWQNRFGDGYNLLEAMEVPPSDSTQISASWHEISVPADGTAYYFWISFCLDPNNPTVTAHEIAVCFGSDNTSCTRMDSGATGVNDPWADFPYDDPYHFLIAKVIIYSSVPVGIPSIIPYRPYITQWLDRDIVDPYNVDSNGSPYSLTTPWRFRGDYSSSAYYYIGDVVMTNETESGNSIRYQWIYAPPYGTTYARWKGPITNKAPASYTPDPWYKLSRSTL